MKDGTYIRKYTIYSLNRGDGKSRNVVFVRGFRLVIFYERKIEIYACTIS